MNEIARIFNHSTDYNRFIEHNGFHVKHTAAVSSYIAQSQTKRHCVKVFVEFIETLVDVTTLPLRVREQIEELESNIEGKCMKIDDVKKLHGLQVSDWSELSKSLGLVKENKRLLKAIETVKNPQTW